MLKDILQSFLPWILYFAFLGPTHHQVDVAIIVGTVTAILVDLKGLKKGFILSWGTLIFFGFMFVFVVLLRNTWINKYSWIFSNGSLAAIAWISILVRRPFTMQYAKEIVSEDKWQHPLFFKINYLLSGFWGIIFLISIGLHFVRLYYPGFNGWTYELISYIPSIFGIWVTTWFPDWYKQKYLKTTKK